MQIAIASKNKGKIREIKSFTNSLVEVQWLTFEDFEKFPDIQETGETFLENAKIKARELSGNINKMTLADDSGLVVDALDNSPGVHSARYAGEGATDKQNRDKLIKKLKNIKEIQNRTARFICSMVLWDPDKGPVFESSGVCEGFIGFEEKGSGGFGYDPIFIPAEYKKTMAEIGQEEKNRISHRGKALKALYGFIEKI